MRGRTPDNVWQEVAADSSHLLRGDAVISLYLGGVVIGLLGGVVGYAVLLHTWRKPPHHRRRPRRLVDPAVPGSP